MEPTFLNDGILLREKYNDYVTLLRGRLSEKRFYHSLAVAKEALRLASHKLPVKCKIIKKEEF